ncbi:[FeFe] hydrogenase H-cluster radical SAM maturase HydE [Desulfosporosinus youngiae]|uniref:Iron-only hydrogenase maturation rSAM protein HydE n=1 Tax=Desulfosporosinus youngiae DSM 17734 TaxID=768710 RepID=H5XWI4_9FIRM|nr:[FeFe] hydrogenase H-cluster radical SAM maturase HydE [Desulfosporosinus youngiae]EHQ90492.1 iron-only hydrogenase maturation rSAM protein HydE [Desulfosporosinus youngiae DSM 17734]
MKKLIDKLHKTRELEAAELKELLENRSPQLSDYLFAKARAVQAENYGQDVYIRGLIEFTNYCKNDCYYCGIRKSNAKAERYRLSKEEILGCCEAGYELGFRTFVLQGGEDGYYTEERMTDIIRSIKRNHPDCALTLSLGEKSYETYRAFFEAGADRYLLRHETANGEHYARLHPPKMLLKNRKQCLWDLKEIGYQVGCGFMVGSPFQTTDCLVEDLLFIKELNPHMVGIGPFIPHHDTPLAREKAGDLELVLFLMGLIRLLLPTVLLPATTALGTIHPEGRELGIRAGGNVVMPNLSPRDVRGKYLLYDNKICTGDEAAECRHCLEGRIEGIGYKIAVSRGDHKSIL